QDIHWSMGAIGYFPTYLLGSLHACQMWEVINRDLPNLDDDMARGDFAPLIAWLREHVHSLGRQYRAGDLIERISGKPLSADPFMRHLEAKVGPLYGI
ncbi:MAG: carboxypeptidase M32, partial [Phycisphaerales bacterium]